MRDGSLRLTDALRSRHYAKRVTGITRMTYLLRAIGEASEARALAQAEDCEMLDSKAYALLDELHFDVFAEAGCEFIRRHGDSPSADECIRLATKDEALAASFKTYAASAPEGTRRTFWERKAEASVRDARDLRAYASTLEGNNG